MTTKNFFTLADGHKAFWVGISVSIAVFGWMLTTIYSMNGTVNTIKTDGDNRGVIQKEISEKVDANYIILQSKANEKENKTDHEILKAGLKELAEYVYSLDKKSNKLIGAIPLIDTTRLLVEENSVKLDTMKRLLITVISGMPYKELNQYVINSK